MVGKEESTVRIAYVINSVEGDGAALPVPAVTRVMRERGHHVEIFALSRRDGRAIASMEQDGLHVHVRDGAPGDHLAAFLWLMRQMEAFSPTVIWTSLTRATLMGQLIGTYRRSPVINWQHSARIKPANARLLRLLRSRTSLWIADSCCVEKMTRETLGIPAKQLACWPIFRADTNVPLATPWQPGEPVRIGSLGRLHPVKGYVILFQALTLLRQRNDLPSFEILIAGEGEERAHLEGLIKRDNLPVRLAGWLAMSSIPKNFWRPCTPMCSLPSGKGCVWRLTKRCLRVCLSLHQRSENFPLPSLEKWEAWCHPVIHRLWRVRLKNCSAHLTNYQNGDIRDVSGCSNGSAPSVSTPRDTTS